MFTPNIDGPNPARKWSANNVGDVFVTAEVELEVAVRPPEPKKTEPKKPADKPADQPAERPGEAPAAEPKPTPEAKPEPKPEAKPEVKPQEPPPPPAREKKTFRARSHLIVTVPLYSRWMALDWEDR